MPVIDWHVAHALATCSIPECKRPHRSRGLCNAHYQWARNSGQLSNFPKVKIGRRVHCSVSGCAKAHANHGLCVMHSQRAKRLGTLDQYSWDDAISAEPPRKFPTSCSEPDCSKVHVARGLCSKHYQQAQRRVRRGRVCSKRGCNNPHDSKGLCHSHYQSKLLRDTNARKRRLELQGVAEQPCSLPGCDALQYDHGLCRSHYRQVKKLDSLDLVEHVFAPAECDPPPAPKRKLTPDQVREIDAAVRKARRDFMSGVITRDQLNQELEACQCKLRVYLTS